MHYSSNSGDFEAQSFKLVEKSAKAGHKESNKAGHHDLARPSANTYDVTMKILLAHAQAHTHAYLLSLSNSPRCVNMAS